MCLALLSKYRSLDIVTPLINSTNTNEVETEQTGQFVDLTGDMTDADGEMMGWTMGVPLFNEATRSEWKLKSFVGVANLENRSGYTFAFGYQQREAVGLVFDDGPCLMDVSAESPLLSLP